RRAGSAPSNCRRCSHSPGECCRPVYSPVQANLRRRLGRLEPGWLELGWLELGWLELGRLEPRGDPRVGVDRRTTTGPDLEVKVGTLRVPGLADAAQVLPDRHLLPHGDRHGS